MSSSGILLAENDDEELDFGVISKFAEELLDFAVFSTLLQDEVTSTSEYKVLLQLFVELLQPNKDNCGVRFSPNSMTCGTDNYENQGIVKPNFCQVT